MTPTAQSAIAREICAIAPIVPVIVVKAVAHAQPLDCLVLGWRQRRLEANAP